MPRPPVFSSRFRRGSSELRLLGYEVSKATVDKYMVRHPKPPSQTWRVFVHNRARDFLAIDFFTIPTATFRILFCFIVLRHHRSVVVHVNANPTADWTVRQIIEAFPDDSAPRFPIRDRDSIYDEFFHQRITHMGIEQVVTANRPLRQYVERLIGLIRRAA